MRNRQSTRPARTPRATPIEDVEELALFALACEYAHPARTAPTTTAATTATA